MALQPLWINKDEWEGGKSGRALIFEGKVPESAVYEVINAEGIRVPEGYRLKKPSYWRVVMERDLQLNFMRYREVTVGGIWITVARFVPEGENKSFDFTAAAAGAQKNETAEREDNQFPF